MTINQIKNAGILTNQWINLQNIASSILMSNDGHIFITPKTTQFYFEESSELLFVRLLRTPLSKTKYEDMVEITVNEKESIKTYYARPHSGGMKDKNIGIYHYVYDINEITGLR